MARAPASLPAGIRLTDHISLGVIAKIFPLNQVQQILADTGKASERERDLPAHVMVYYAIALALYMTASTREVLRCLLEGLRWLWGAEAVRVAGKSGISQARTRLGEAPLRRLYERVVRPIATPATRGRGTGRGGWSAWTGPAWTWPTRRRTAPPSGDPAPAAARAPSRRSASWRWSRTARTCCSALAWAASGGRDDAGPRRSAGAAAGHAVPGRPAVLRPRALAGAAATGADLLWRVKHNLRLPREAVLADGSYLTTIYPSEKDRRHRTKGIQVRVIEYRLEGVAEAEPLYRLVTTILDPAEAPAAELAALYHERWEIEGALAELKTHLRGARVVLRSKTPALVRQEFWGLLLAHFAVRGLMHEAALRADEDPDRLSFVHAVRVVRRKLPLFAALSPSGQARPA